LQAKRQILIPSVKILLDKMIEKADFRVSKELYSTIIQAAGE
jgi:hypothetical protein